MRLFVGLAALCAMTVGAAAEVVEGWTIDRLDVSNRLTGCAMTTDYQDGTRFALVLFPKQFWGIVLTNQKYTLVPDSKFKVVVKIDGDVVASATANVLSNKTFFVSLDGVDLYRSLQAGQRMDLDTTAGKANFSLKGTRRAMDAVIDCASRLGDAPRQPPPAAPPPPAASAKPKSDFAMVPARDSIVVLSNLLSLSGITGHRMLPLEKDNELIKFVLADGTVGTFSMATGRDAPKADDYAQYVKNGLMKSCTGRVTIDQQSMPTSDGTVIRKVMFGCAEPHERKMIETTVIRRADGVMIDISYYNFSKQDQPLQIELKDRDMLTKAAISVSSK